MKDKLQEGDVYVGYGSLNQPMNIRGEVTQGVVIEGKTCNEFRYHGPSENLRIALEIMTKEAAKQGIKVHSNNADRS